MNAIELFERLAIRFADCKPRVTGFPSGAAWLDLTIGGTRYCVQYLPSHKVFGVSNVEDASPFWEGIDEEVKSPEKLELRIEQMVIAAKM